MREYRLIGHDTFSGEAYRINGNKILKTGFFTEKGARRAAKKLTKAIEETQPTETSGGQGSHGIQDRIYIQKPDGSQCALNTRPELETTKQAMIKFLH